MEINYVLIQNNKENKVKKKTRTISDNYWGSITFDFQLSGSSPNLNEHTCTMTVLFKLMCNHDHFVTGNVFPIQKN